MADPFEVRMRFSSQLQHLNASVISLQKAASYALKYKDMDEDLHSCILEQLERTNMNTRANIMFFIEHFMEMATRENHTNYISMLQRDIIRVVDAVAPDNESGAANVKVVRLVCPISSSVSLDSAPQVLTGFLAGTPADAQQVLQGLLVKNFLDNQVVTQIEEVLKERETSAHDAGLSSPVNVEPDLGEMPPSQAIPKPGCQSAPRLDKRQVEQRIEEDRERHKRLRESIWHVPNRQTEIDKLWDETSDLGEDDHVMGREEFLAREQAVSQQCPHYTPRNLNDLYSRNGAEENGRRTH